MGERAIVDGVPVDVQVPGTGLENIRGGPSVMMTDVPLAPGEPSFKAPRVILERLARRADQTLSWFESSCDSTGRALQVFMETLRALQEGETPRPRHPKKMRRLLAQVDSRLNPLLGRFAQVRDALEALALALGWKPGAMPAANFTPKEPTVSVRQAKAGPVGPLFRGAVQLQQRLLKLSKFAQRARRRIIDIGSRVREGKENNLEGIGSLVGEFSVVRHNFWEDYLGLSGGLHKRIEELEQQCAGPDAARTLVSEGVEHMKRRPVENVVAELRLLAEQAGIVAPAAPAAPVETPEVQHARTLKGLISEMRRYFEADTLDALEKAVTNYQNGMAQEGRDAFDATLAQISSDLHESGKKEVLAIAEKLDQTIKAMRESVGGTSDDGRGIGGPASPSIAGANSPSIAGGEAADSAEPKNDAAADKAETHAEPDGDEDAEGNEPEAEKEEEPASDEDEESEEEEDKESGYKESLRRLRPALSEEENAAGDQDGDEEEPVQDQDDQGGMPAERPVVAGLMQLKPLAGYAAQPGRKVGISDALPAPDAQTMDDIAPKAFREIGNTQVPAVVITTMREEREAGRAMRESAWLR